MRLYEGLFLVDNTEARRNYEAVSQSIDNIITKYGGEVRLSEKWGERKLAYPIKRRDRGTYVLVYFNAPPDSLPQIRRDCKLDEVVLRNMIVRASRMPEKPEEEAPVEQPAEDKTTAQTTTEAQEPAAEAGDTTTPGLPQSAEKKEEAESDAQEPESLPGEVEPPEVSEEAATEEST